MIRILVVVLLSQFVMLASSAKEKQSTKMPAGKDHAFIHDGIARTYKAPDYKMFKYCIEPVGLWSDASLD